MDNQHIISVLERVRVDLFHKRHGTADLQLRHLITTLSEPAAPVTTTPTDDKPVNF